jgi:hypothetical protein
MKLQAFGQSKPEILQSQSQSRPENRFFINRLDGSSRTTRHQAVSQQKAGGLATRRLFVPD